MYQGIIEQYIKVSSLKDSVGLREIGISADTHLLEGLKLGSSIALDGICFTVTRIEGNNIFVDAMQETLQRTTIGSLKVGDSLNFERSAKFGDEIGGHELSGHIDTVATISNISTPENNYIITFEVPKQFIKYIFIKGYIAINGASLTVSEVNKELSNFKVFLIPETLKRTTFGFKKLKDNVNIEIDRKTQVIVETVERVIGGKSAD